MATPTHVQASALIADVSDVVTITLTSVVTGNAILVGIADAGTNSRTFTVTDAQGNTYTQRQRILNAAGRVTEIWNAANVVTTAGSVVITITASGTATCYGLAVEAGEIDSDAPFDVADQLAVTAATSHPCSPTTAIDTTTDVYCFSVGVMNGTSGGGTAATNWTELADATNVYMQYRISATALTDERGIYTTVSSRNSANCIASFKGVAAAGGQPTMRRWGGVPSVGGQGVKSGGGYGSGNAWGRSRSGRVVIPRWISDEERRVA